MEYGWSGEKVRLVPLDLGRHLENACAWMNDPEVTQFLLVGDFPMTRLAEQEWFERAMKSDGTEINFAIETLDGRHVGFSGCHAVNYRHGYATTGSLIGSKELWGQGLGTDAARVRARYLFEVIGMRVLLSSTLEGNDRSLRMQTSAGYEIYGRAPKKYWKRGMYRDEILTVLTRERWASMA